MSEADNRASREARRYRELREITVARSAARGDMLRIHCLACQRTKDILSARLVDRHGDKLLSELSFSCSDCVRRGRRLSGSKPPGTDTWHEVLWPDDRP